MKLGFIGTGVITEAIVTGLLSSDYPFDGIILSQRNTEISARLAAADDRLQRGLTPAGCAPGQPFKTDQTKVKQDARAYRKNSASDKGNRCDRNGDRA